MGTLPGEGISLRVEVADAVIDVKEDEEARRANSTNMVSRTRKSFLADGSLTFKARKGRPGRRATSGLSSIVNGYVLKQLDPTENERNYL